MGFSVSSAAAIVFIGLFVTFGVVYTAMANSTERIDDAKQGASDGRLDQKNTDIDIVSASYSSGTLSLDVNNTGSRAITLDETELLADNEYLAQSSFDTLTVAGQSDTDLWLPGEQLHVEVSLAEQPDRVKVVAAHGVADREVI